MITFVFGTRPEAIKLVPIIIKFRESRKFKLRIVSTGQHKDLVNDVLNLFEINLDNNLNLMKSKQSLSYLSYSIIKNLDLEFSENPPQMVMVQGDTTSALSAALCAFYRKIPIAHVEAGLRTETLSEPFPEEANRRIISQISNLHFAPTNRALKNLINNGIKSNVHVTGNSVIDALILASKKISDIKFDELDHQNKKFILTTIHRRENWGQKLIGIANGLKKILDKFPETMLILPMHPNKIVREPLLRILGNNKQALLLEPLTYNKLVYAIKKCYFVVTDSGGLQEEAPTFGKPVLVIRDSTERLEGIEAGSSILVGTNEFNILNEASSLLEDHTRYRKFSKIVNPYGDGNASQRILNYVCKYLKTIIPSNKN